MSIGRQKCVAYCLTLRWSYLGEEGGGGGRGRRVRRRLGGDGEGEHATALGAGTISAVRAAPEHGRVGPIITLGLTKLLGPPLEGAGKCKARHILLDFNGLDGAVDPQHSHRQEHRDDDLEAKSALIAPL